MKKVLWVFIWIFCLTFLNETQAIGNDEDNMAKHIIYVIPPNGIVINEPGTYVFLDNLTWHPRSNGAAITIEANDVTLNMQGFTLNSASSVFKTIGILATGSNNLQIINGTIKNMGLSGIQCNQCINLSISEIEVDGLYVNDTATYTVPTGILATECVNVSIDSCTVKNILVQTGSSAAIQLTETLSSQVTNCRIKNLLNQDGACTGIGHLLCDDALVKSCTLDGIQSEFIDNLNTEGHTAIAIVPVLTTNFKILECSITNITGCCDDAHGMSIFICDKAIVEKCNVSNVFDGAGPAQQGAKATGIEIYASDVKISDCFVKNITAINPQDKQATGFSCALCTGVEFIRCQAENVNVFDENGYQSAGLGYGTGFGWAPDPRPEFVFPATNVLYRDCTAKYCQVGFDTWYHIDSVWDHIVSIDNGIAVMNLNHSQRTYSCDPCSECGCLQTGCFPIPYIVTIDNVAKNNKLLHVKDHY
jgi:hypothetical protein